MTGLSSLILHATVIEHCLPVWAVIVGLADVLVTRFACVSAGIKRWIGRIVGEMFALGGIGIRLGRRFSLLRGILRLGVLAGSGKHEQRQHEDQNATRSVGQFHAFRLQCRSSSGGSTLETFQRCPK